MTKTTQQLNRILIAIAKTEVENFIKDNFKNEGFAGEKWKKRRTKNRSDRNNPNQNRALLIGESRQLFRSIKVEIAGKSTLRIVSSVPYAKIHNEGGTINPPVVRSLSEAETTHDILTNLSPTGLSVLTRNSKLL